MTSCTAFGHIYKANVTKPRIEDYYSPMIALNELLMSTSDLTAEEKALIVPCGYDHLAEGDI